MNKRAFTLIEVLAVIVLLGVVSMIAIPSVRWVINRSKQTSCETDKNVIIDAAMSFANNCIYNDGCSDGKKMIKELRDVKFLIDNKYLDSKYAKYSGKKFFIEGIYNESNPNAEEEQDYKKYEAKMIVKVDAPKYTSSNEELYTLRSGFRLALTRSRGLGDIDENGNIIEYPVYEFVTKNDIERLEEFVNNIEPNNEKYKELLKKYYYLSKTSSHESFQIIEDYEDFVCK